MAPTTSEEELTSTGLGENSSRSQRMGKRYGGPDAVRGCWCPVVSRPPNSDRHGRAAAVHAVPQIA
eukprot:2700468-Pyramimonas_sp.AAC.1